MPKVTVSAAKRVKEFPNTSLVNQNGKLWCNSCTEEVDFMKKSVVEKHVNSSKHIKSHESLNSALQNQPLINQRAQSDERWKSMAEAFAIAGVPLNVFENTSIRSWLDQNVKSGSSLPSVHKLRTLLCDSGRDDKQDTILFLRDKRIAIMADESIDIKNRKILNILAKPLEPNAKFKVMSVKILDKCNASEVAHQIDAALIEHFVAKRNVNCFVSDNTPYMILAGQKLMAFSENMLHSTCWAHILHLVSEEIRTSMDEADRFISSMKAALTKAPARRVLLLEVLKEFSYAERLPPVPILTRWTTWVAAAEYYWTNFDAILEFIKRSADDSSAMRQLKEMTQNENMAQQLERLSRIYQGLKSSIVYMENDQVPASSIWLNIQAIGELLKSCGLGSDKLTLYFGEKHPALSFWKDVQCLDPRMAQAYFSDDSLPVSLRKFEIEPVPLVEIIKYKLIVKQGISSHPFEFWINYKEELPSLSKLALSALCVPASSASVERSFSVLKRVYTKLRSSFTDQNLELHLKIAYNTKQGNQEDASDSEDDYN